MSSVIRSLMVKVGVDLGDFSSQMKNISKDLKKAGKEIADTGKTLTKGLTIPILGAVAAVTGLTVNAGKNADELITLANKTGITTEALQELQYAARFVDVEVETMTDSMFKMTQRMADARDGSKAQVEAFKALGIVVTNQDGTLRNAKDVWYEAIDALGKIANEADRDALAYELFGRSAQELNPLIVAGSEKLKDLRKEAHEVGAVISDEDLKALGAFDDMLQKMQAVLATAGAKLGAAFIPLFEKLAPIIEKNVVPAIQKFTQFISDIIDKFLSLDPGMQNFILALITAAVAIGPVLTVVGKLTTGLSGVIGSVSKAAKVLSGGGGIIKALTALIGPAGVVILVIAAIAAAAYLIIKNWGPISNFFQNLWKAVSGWFATTWDNIKKFVTETIPQIVKSIADFFMGLPEKLGYALGFALGTLIKWGTDAVKWAIENVPKIIAKIGEFFSQLPGKIWDWTVTAIDNIGNWATALIEKIKIELPKVITNIVKFFQELPGKIAEIGRNIITGLWSGIQENISWLWGKIKDFASGFTKGLKDALGIKSPSKVMAEQVGRWIPAGIAKGILANKNIIGNAISGIGGNISFAKMDSGWLSGAMDYMRSSRSFDAQPAYASVRHDHSGRIEVYGINSKGQLVDSGILDMLAQEIRSGSSRYVNMPGAAKALK